MHKLLFAIVLLASPAQAAELVGRVVAVDDGDTLTLWDEQTQVKFD